MPTRGPFVRSLLAAGGLGGLVLALVGGVALRASGVVAVLLAGLVAACLATGVAREVPGREHSAPLEVAIRVGAVTVGVLLVLSGTAAVAGGVVAALVAVIGAITALTVWLVCAAVGGRAVARRPTTAPASAEDLRRPSQPLSWPAAPSAGSARTDGSGGPRLLPPVCDLPTDVLGQEWVRTTGALTGRLEPAARSSIVRRRQDALDELEQRDPAGFARWLASGPLPGSDPADYVEGGSTSGPDAA